MTNQRKAIEQHLVSLISSILEVEEVLIKPGISFEEMGFKSFSMRKLALELNKTYGTKPDPSILYEYDTIEAVTTLLIEKEKALPDKTKVVDIFDRLFRKYFTSPSNAN